MSKYFYEGLERMRFFLSNLHGIYNSTGTMLFNKMAVLFNTFQQSAADPMGTFAQVDIPTQSKLTVSGLVSGVKYWFRVAAISAEGQSDWSGPAIARAK